MIKNWIQFLDKKILKPMVRQYRNPHFLARSTGIGMGLAFAPFPGQIPVVGLMWLITKRSKWRFSLAIAIAWTFISNVFTNLPLFYLYYRTGEIIRNQANTLSYQGLKNIFDSSLFSGIKYISTELGYSIVIGSLVYMLIFGLLGYFIGYLLALGNKANSDIDETTGSKKL